MHNPESPPPIIEDRPFRSSSSGSRLPPQDLDAERAVLGSILIHNDAVFTALEELVPEDFYRPGHQLIMRAMTELATKSEPVDTVTLSAVLKGKGELEAVGGLAAIVALSTAVPTAANVKYYADIVRKKSTLRKLISAATEIVTQSYEAPDPDVVVDDAERMVFEVCQTKARQGITRIDKVVAEAFRRIEKLAEQKKDITGVATGIGDLDGLTAGLQPSDLIIVAGRPSMGKCLAADSEIVLEDGSIATIEELVRAKCARLFTLDDRWRLVATSAMAFVDDGIKPVFRVTTRLGRVVETTASHPFLTLDGWRPLAELSVGTCVAVPHVLPVFGDRPLLRQQLYVCLHAASRGQLASLPSALFRAPKAQLEFFLNRLFGGDPMSWRGAFNARSVRVARQLQHLLLRFGIVAGRDGHVLTIRDSATDPLHIVGDICWDAIVAIEPMGAKQVYDLAIPDTHNFVANDICVHNTSLAVGMGTFAALHGPTPTAVFSLEMSKEQLVMRMLCSEGRINSARMRTGFLTEDDWPKLARVAGKLSEAPIFIDDTGSISVLEVRAKCRRLAAESGLGLVIVDYLQLMRGSPNAQSREQEISEISRGLKALAKELHVPVMALSQLNRGLEQRQDKRPVLSDLRESGAIEQDADVIMFVYRDEVYNPESADRGIAEIIIGKQRNGPIGVARSRFFHEYTRFENLAHDDQMPPH